MDRIEGKPVGFFLPGFADEFISGENAEGLEPFGVVVSGDEVTEMTSQQYKVSYANARCILGGGRSGLDCVWFPLSACHPPLHCDIIPPLIT